MKWYVELYAMQKEVELHMIKYCSPVEVDVIGTLAGTLAETWTPISTIE